ncbi:helix-turn-helix protein [Paraperlucidibaca baekdonensis]|uniref:Helix-turn-helix protein n=1 Tax=Paraperlucidibaca baekdonensis TaxID=748120 RepID=A0A3E0H1K5_9GAMM|nr:helix-turn-helix protein [Paraperlucidibaca baekdonensis]
MHLNNYVTVAMLKDKLGISESTQWRMRQDGRLGFFKIGRGIRYNLEEVLQSLQRK